MAYITRANAANIVRQIAPERLNDLSEALYIRKIVMFNRREENVLRGIRQLFRQAANFVTTYFDVHSRPENHYFIFDSKLLDGLGFHLCRNCLLS